MKIDVADNDRDKNLVETDKVKHGEVITEKKRRRGKSSLAGTGGKQKKK